MAITIVQARGFNITEATTAVAMPFTGTPTAGNRIFAALYVNTADGANPGPSDTPPEGWTHLITERVFASGLYAQLFTKPSDGTETSFATTLPFASTYSGVVWEVSGLGAQIAVTSGETDAALSMTTTAVTTEAGGHLFVFAFQPTFSASFSAVAPDVEVGRSAPTVTRAFVLYREADAATETVPLNSTQDGFGGWVAVSYADGGGSEPDPDVVEVTGTGSFDVSGTGTVAAVAAGSWALDTTGITLSPPVGAHLRLIGTTSALACWVTVTSIAGAVLYVEDAQQPGDATLAALAAAEAAGSVEIRRYS